MNPKLSAPKSIEFWPGEKTPSGELIEILNDLDRQLILKGFSAAWLSGFQNVLCYGQTDCDDDNSFDRQYERIQYEHYKKGARAALELLKCSFGPQRAQQHQRRQRS